MAIIGQNKAISQKRDISCRRWGATRRHHLTQTSLSLSYCDVKYEYERRHTQPPLIRPRVMRMNLNDSQAGGSGERRKTRGISRCTSLHNPTRGAFRICLRDTLDFLVNSAGLLYAESFVDRVIFFFVTTTDKTYQKNYVVSSYTNGSVPVDLRSTC